MRVAYTNGLGAGPGGSWGAAAGVSIGAHGATVGAAAGADAEVEGWTTRRWTVDADEVPALLVALAAEGTAAGLPFRAVDVVAQGIDDVLAWFGRDADLGGTASFPGVPDPDHVEQLVGVSASAGLALGGPDASSRTSAAATGTTTSRLLAGTAADGDRSSLVIEEQGQVSAALGGALRRALGIAGVDAPVPSVQATTRVEVPLAAGHRDDRPVLVTMSTDDGSDRTVVRVAVDRGSAGAAGRRLVDALSDLARGDGSRAGDRLAGLRLPEGSVQVDLGTARVERSTLSLPIQLPGASVAPGGSLTTITAR